MDTNTKHVIMALGRMACGTAILLGSHILNINGTLQTIALILLSVPIEYLPKVVTK